MIKNINKTNGLLFSQEILLALVSKGLTREKAYALVQKNAMEVWKNDLDFKSILLKDNKIMEFLTKNELDQLFNIDKVKININKIFDRLDL